MFDKVFYKYADYYRNIFSMMYPAKGSNGFTERNLSVNFSKAYESIANMNGEHACSWFEFPFGIGKHIDAVILNYDAREVLIMEAKRYQNGSVESKIQSVGVDIDRISSVANELKTQRRINMSRIDKCYGVILADVWPEKYDTQEVLESYLAGVRNSNSVNSFLNKYYRDKKISNVRYDVQGFQKLGPNGYYLVTIYWEIK